MEQPVSDIQLDQLQIEWVPYSEVKPNQYNPNRMTWHDRQLLRQSVLEDGWTQPIVTLPDGTIVDGEQRWTVAGMKLRPDDIQEIIDRMEKRQADGAPVSTSILARLKESKARLEAAIADGSEATLASITGGLVPITRLDLGDDAHKMISTIRHNRARGMHQLDSMVDITKDLVKLGLDVDDLETRLGMDDEEITRFLSDADGLLQEAGTVAEAFSPAVVPTPVAELGEDELIKREIERSAEAASEAKRYQEALVERDQAIHVQFTQELEKRGGKLNQMERDEILEELEASTEVPEKPKPPVLKKLVLFFSEAEYTMVREVLEPSMARSLVALCQLAGEDGIGDKLAEKLEAMA